MDCQLQGTDLLQSGQVTYTHTRVILDKIPTEILFWDASLPYMNNSTLITRQNELDFLEI